MGKYTTMNKLFEKIKVIGKLTMRITKNCRKVSFDHIKLGKMINCSILRFEYENISNQEN